MLIADASEYELSVEVYMLLRILKRIPAGTVDVEYNVRPAPEVLLRSAHKVRMHEASLEGAVEVQKDILHSQSPGNWRLRRADNTVVRASGTRNDEPAGPIADL